jgi:hypothetical protein
MTKISMTKLQSPHPFPLPFGGEGRFGHPESDDWHLLRRHLKTPSCACLPVGRDGDEARLLKAEKINQMLKQA